MWWWILTILLFLISVVSSTLLFFALRRINNFEMYLIQIQEIIEYSKEKMNVVDASGHYKSDDETGFFFDEIKRIQEILNDLFEDEEIEK